MVVAGVGIVAAGGTGAVEVSALAVVVGSGDDTWITPEHCLHRIFLPESAWDTLVCHWQLGHLAVIIAALAASATCPRTMGAAAFLAAAGDAGASVAGEVAEGADGLGGGVSCAVELADVTGGGGGADTGGSATGVAVTGTSGVTVEAGVEGKSCFFPSGIIFPHLGHLTSAGIREDDALIFNLALQLPHSMGIRSMPCSFFAFLAPLSKK